MADIPDSTIDNRPPTLREFFATDVFTVKTITVLAVFLAIRTILAMPPITLFIGGVKVITFTHVTNAIIAMYFGPIAAVAFGFAGDPLGFMASNGTGGGYFPPYAISEIVTGFLFACFFFKRKVTLPRIIFAWFFNLFIVLLGLNSLWMILRGIPMTSEIEFFGSSFTLIQLRLVINLIQSPLQIYIVYLLLTRIRKLDRFIR